LTDSLPDSALDRWRQLAGSVARFLAVGVAAAALDYAILNAGLGLGATPYLARLASLVPVITLTWLANRRLTFRTKAPPSWREYGQYALLSAAGLAVNFGIYWLCLLIGAPVGLAFVTGIGCAAVFNFFRYRALLR
jgi:putative flippase GtrA